MLLGAALGSLHHMADEYAGGDGAYAAGNRGDGLHDGLHLLKDGVAGTCTDGLWPTVTIRQIMWALKMKPLQKQRWETVFDRRDI